MLVTKTGKGHHRTGSGVGTIAAVAVAATPFGRQGSQAVSLLHQSHMQLHVYISN